jgi:hypothetical protein
MVRTHAVIATALLTIVFGAGSASAFAHNVVEQRSPEPGSTITESPVTISIATNDEFFDLGGKSRGFGIVLLDANGVYYGGGCIDITERVMSTSVAFGEPGEYSIVYQIVSADGHSLSESYDITFAPTGVHTPATGYSTPPLCGVEPPMENTQENEGASSAVLPPSTAASTETLRSNGWLIGSGIAIVVAVIAARAITRARKAQP